MKPKTYFSLLMAFSLFFLIAPMHAQESETAAASGLTAASIVKVGDVAPDFTVNMLDGSIFRLSDKKGKVALLIFWATWCGPCMLEFNEIPEKIIKRFEEKADFVLIPVSREETLETVQKKMIQLGRIGVNFPVALDPDRKVFDLYATSEIPRNYLIGRDGKVVHATIGFNKNDFERLVSKLAELLE